MKKKLTLRQMQANLKKANLRAIQEDQTIIRRLRKQFRKSK